MRMRSFGMLLVLFGLLMLKPLNAQRAQLPPYFKTDWSWVDSVYRSLSVDERIAQLVMVPAWSNRDEKHLAALEKLVTEYGIGGICFFQGGPQRQAAMINRLQSVSKVPLLMAIDAEWGLAMRLDSTPRYPFQMALGAIRDERLVYRMGLEIAREMKEAGLQMNFAPVLDVNNNPANPVINYRSFGEDPSRVASLGVAYTLGLQDGGVLATGKHFPGHGDTNTDSHYALPLISHSRERFDQVELVPFRRAINTGLASIMVAHLEVPALQDSAGIPTTLSERTIKGLLRGGLQFRGLTVTDALNMKGVTSVFPPGEIEVRALEAGNDMVVYVEDVALAIRSIRQALESGRLLPVDIENSCKMVLAAKRWAGLHDLKPLAMEGITERINDDEAAALNWQLVQASLTVLRNEQGMIPVKNIDSLRLAALSIGAPTPGVFQKRLGDYAEVSCYNIAKTAAKEHFDRLLRELQSYDRVIVGMHDTDQRPAKNFGLTQTELDFISALSAQNKVILVWFGNPYALDKFGKAAQVPGLVLTYQESDLAQDLAAQLIFGAVGANGRLPVSSGGFSAGYGLEVDGNQRLSFAPTGVAGLDGTAIRNKIDSIALAGIVAQAYPGCEVLVARHGSVIFHQCYGFHTYDNILPVQKSDLFDMASVTKVSASLPLIMQLYDQGKLELDEPLYRYWPDFRGKDKRDMTVREQLAHVGGLYAWIPFWRDTKRVNGKFRWNTFSEDSSAKYPVRVSENLWMHRDYARKIYKSIKQSPMSEDKKYVYSDLGFILWPQIIEKLTGENFERLLQEHFYRPLGATSLMFNPLRKYGRDQIIPTECDTFFRMELLHGYVHDEGAAMLGGVSGHAGLFGTAIDLAKLWQMYLWGGRYGGDEYLRPSTLAEFSRCQFCNEGIRRGLGFDKPLVNNQNLPKEESYPTWSCSSSSYGHSGYTGTFVWVDPAFDLLYIFLCNRVYPTRDNNKLSELNIRTGILQAVYEHIL